MTHCKLVYVTNVSLHELPWNYIGLGTDLHCQIRKDNNPEISCFVLKLGAECLTSPSDTAIHPFVAKSARVCV